MFGPKLKLEKDLYERCREHAERVGYSSVDEFVMHVLEKELAKSSPKSDAGDDAITKRLKGLGYLG